MRKIIRIFNCGEFGHGEIDYPRNDNKNKDEMRGEANVDIRSSDDLCKVY